MESKEWTEILLLPEKLRAVAAQQTKRQHASSLIRPINCRSFFFFSLSSLDNKERVYVTIRARA